MFDEHGRVAGVWSDYRPGFRDAAVHVEAQARRLHPGVPIRSVSMSPSYRYFEFDVEFDGTIPGVAGTPMGHARYHVDSVTGTVVETFP